VTAQIQHWIDGITQIANSLILLLGVLTLLAAQVWNLISSIRNGRDTRAVAQVVKEHGEQITRVEEQTNHINAALTVKSTAAEVANTQLTSDLAAANERLISGTHPP